MRKISYKISLLICSCFILIYGCKKSGTQTAQQAEISQEALDKILALGFSNKNVTLDEGNYVVEGDILLSPGDLNSVPDTKLYRIGTEEQYRTNNLVTALPRVITVSISSRISQHGDALDEAINRFNAEGLRITFQRVASGGNIQVVKGSGNYLASAGFPSGGNHYGQVKLNSNAVVGQPLHTVASILAHEIGHCIGFRHTDFMNRAYSCGGQPVNEGSSSVGAVHIPGTPEDPDAGSWMLSCIGSRQDRPFNSNDKKALDVLY